MVTDRPIQGVALGGASAEVGAVCQTVADRLAAETGLLTSIWLERGGRLRCVAGTGDRPGREGVSPTAGAVGATFTADVDTVVPEDSGRREDAPAVGEACFPIRSDDCVIGVLEVRFAGPLRSEDLDRVRRAAAGLGDQIAALGGPPAESAAQRTLRHMTSLSALEDPAAIASAVLSAAIDLMGLESAALVRPAAHAEHTARGRLGAALAATPAAPGPFDAGLATRPAAPGPFDAGLAATPAAPGPFDAGLAATPAAPAPLDTALTATPTASIGPLGTTLADLPAAALAAMTHPAGDAAQALVLHPADDPTHPGLAPLRAAGVRTLVAVSLVAQGRPRGVLLLAGRAERRVPTEDVELLELLAAHAATCLRTADLMRSLRERAATDPLTGLGHHATFHEALARTHRRPQTAVVVVDLDGFKRINDTYGHQHGDQVLRAIAAALSGALRRGDTLFRIGGDEFAALLAVADADEALEAGTRLRAAVAEAGLGVTVSIGVAVPQLDEPDGALVGRADRALYRVKAMGRDGVAVADPDGPEPIGHPAGALAAHEAGA
jgi:diguanylate cyclase (GGDEF)-like protein